MSAHNTPYELNNADVTILDPGDGYAIPAKYWNQHVGLTIAASAQETGTITAPTRAGQRIHISAVTVGASGYRILTAPAAMNQTGNTTVTLDAAGERIILEAYETSTTPAWKVTDYDGATLGS